MVQIKTPSPKATFTIVIALLPIIALAALGSAVSGLEAINPENHGKTLLFPIGNDAAEVVKIVFVFGILPLSLLMAIVGGVNLKIKNNKLNISLIFLILFMAAWLLFTSWALNATFVEASDNNSVTSSDGNSNVDNDLQIKTMDLQ